jgi:hypothetical protein
VLLHDQSWLHADKLLLQPMQNSRAGDALPKDCFIVVDPLDECEDIEQIEALLKLLGCRDVHKQVRIESK